MGVDRTTMRAILLAVTVLALATSTTYACNEVTNAVCLLDTALAATNAATTGASLGDICSAFQAHIDCYSTSSCLTTANCNTISNNINTSPYSCSWNNPCSATTTTKVTSQTVDFGTGITSTSYTGVQKSNFECGYFNALGQSVTGYTAANSTAYCTSTATGCTTTPGTTSLVNGTSVTTAATTTCSSVTNTYVTGLHSVSSSFSSSRRANKVSFVGSVLSTLLTEAQITQAGTTLAANVATLTTAINAAYANGGQTVPTFTVVAGSIGAVTQTASSAGTVAPFFGMALAMLFAVLNY